MIGLGALLCSLPTSLLAQTEATDTLSVDQAVRRVISTHPAIRRATEQMRAAGYVVEEHRSAYYPTLDGTAVYSRVGPVPSITLPGDGAFSLYPANNYNAHLALQQTLYDFGKRSTTVEVAQADVQTASDNVRLLESELAYRTIGIFYASLYLQRSLEVEDEQIAALNRHLAVTRELQRTGTATEFDVLTTQVRVANASSRRVDIAATLRKQLIALRELTGIERGRSIELRGDFEVEPLSLDPDSLMELARAQRPELVLRRDVEHSAEIQTQLAGLGDRPTLDLNISAGFRNGFVPNLNRLKGNFEAGMLVQVPVFNGFRRRHRVEASRAALGAAQAQTRAVELEVVTDVEQAIADVRASQDKLEVSELQLRQAEQAVEMARVRYRAGVITNLDVLDAETSLAEAKLVQLKARYDLVTSRYGLERAVGARVW
jgi:outer membrane protein